MATLGFFRQGQSPEADTPMARLFSATMRGNAEVASQSATKAVAEKQVEANAKTSITIKPGGVVDIKNADPAVFDGTQRQELEDARDAPHLAVASAESAMSSPAPADDPLAPIYDITDKHLGYRVPRPSDPDIQEKLSTPDGIRELTREIGGNSKDAEAAIRAMRNGQLTPAAMRETVAAFRAKKFEAIQKTIAAPLNEVQDMERLKQDRAEESRRTAAEQRLVADQRFRVRNQQLDQANTMQFGSIDEYLTVAEQAMADVGGFRPGDREQFASAYRANRTKALDARMAALRGEEGKQVIEAYEDTPADARRFAAENIGVANPSDFELNRFTRVAKGLLEAKSDRQRKEHQSIAAEARREAREVRQVLAAERAVAEQGRKNRIDERADHREARIAHSTAVTPIVKRIEELTDKMNRNAIEAKKPETTDAMVSAFARQNIAYAAELADKRAELNEYLVTQEEYDAMLAEGLTEAEIAADGIRLRKARK